MLDEVILDLHTDLSICFLMACVALAGELNI